VPGDEEVCLADQTPQAGVSSSGERRGRHNIWHSFTNDQQNRALIIHDSGGFEAGEDGTLRDVEVFIDYRGNQTSLAEQLHCIWCVKPSSGQWHGFFF
jgi:hypothetical protein